MPKNMERTPINIFSKKTSLFNCCWDMPSTVKIPNCFFRTFKNVPIEYSKKKNEKNAMTTSEIVINMFRKKLTFVICNLGWNK